MVRYNKKGNTITDPMIVLIILVVVGTLSFGFFQFSTDLALNSNNKLSDESIIYIAENNGFKINDLNLSENILTDVELESSFYSTVDNATSSDKDDSLEFLYYREQSVTWRGLTNSLYNLPYYIVRSLGLNLNDWTYVINGLNLLIWAIIFFVVYKIIRGIIK